MTCSCESADLTTKVMKSRRIDQYLETFLSRKYFEEVHEDKYKQKYANVCKRIVYQNTRHLFILFR